MSASRPNAVDRQSITRQLRAMFTAIFCAAFRKLREKPSILFDACRQSMARVTPARSRLVNYLPVHRYSAID